VPERRRKALDSIGFDWDPIESAWNAQYSKLVTYMNQNGKCNVPNEYPQDPPFGWWVNTQRKTQDTMDEQKRRLLNEIGFEWDPQETAWKEQFQKLMAYKRECGNCNVPRKYPQDPSLAIWVTHQRTYHSRGCLGLDRVASLEKIGFRWKMWDITPHSIKNEALWQTNYYGKLLPFLYIHGHCRVPQRCTADQALGQWVGQQRKLFQKGILRKDRMVLLDRVGLIWSRECPTR
jgi:hypothetical protein